MLDFLSAGFLRLRPVRLVRFHFRLVRLLGLLLFRVVPRRTSTVNAGWQCSPPDLNREFRLAVFPARPQPQVPLGSVPAGPQPQVQDGSVPQPPAPERTGRCRTSTNTQPQTQPQTHSHKHDHNHIHNHAITNTTTTHTAHSTQPQHTTTTPNHNTQPQHTTAHNPRTHKQSREPENSRPWQRAPHHGVMTND